MAVDFGDLNYCAPPTPAHQEHAAQLFGRIGEGVIVPRVQMAVDGWQPLPNKCHENAHILAEKIAGYRAVTGWLLFEFERAFTYVRFAAHSVVENEAGELFDITPPPAENPGAALYPFIRSKLSHDDFHSAVYVLTEMYGAANLDYGYRPA